MANCYLGLYAYKSYEENIITALKFEGERLNYV